jgi:ferrochelatase
MTKSAIDGVLLIGFGGPTPGCCQRYDPCPGREAACFVHAVVGGRPGAQTRIDEVAAHYDVFGGYSPFNALTLQQAEDVSAALQAKGHTVPVRVGMRFWPPYVDTVLADLAALGCRHLLGVILSPFQCAASWEHYQQSVADGLAALGERGPRMTYLPPWHTQAGFVEAIADGISQAAMSLGGRRGSEAALVYTAHAIPDPMADRAPYTRQFRETADAVTKCLGRQEHRIAYQSQVTGTPVPWLQPDINDVIQRVHEDGFRDMIVAPIGFLCDHMEVLYDLDVQAKETAQACGLGYVRSGTVGNHPAFVAMLSDLIGAHLAQNSPPSGSG